MNKSRRGLARAAGLISAATMLSRILGLVREQLFAALMGAGFLSDAFLVAFRIPNLLRDLFAEGALAQAFIPTFKADLRHNGQDSAYDLANRVAGTLLVVIGLVVGVAAIFTPTIVTVLAGDFEEVAGKFELTVLLTRIMLPFLLVVSLAAVAMGMLNAQNRFAAPALAPAMFNVASIAIGLLLWALGVHGRWVVIGWSLGTLLGGALQLGIQLPPLLKMGYRPRLGLDWRLRDERVRRIGKLMLPAIAGLAAVQINIIVNTAFAATEEGAVSWLNYAFRFLQLPIGVFGVAIATVSTTRYADSAADANHGEMAQHLVEGLRLVAFLTVPSTIGLVLLGEPIVRLIYQHGRFGSHDTLATADALSLYATGLVAYSAVKVVAPAFYATNKALIAVAASVSAVAGNLILNITLHPHYGYRVLALGTAVAAILNFGVLYAFFHRSIHAIDHRSILRQLVRVVSAALLMGVAVHFSKRGLIEILGTESLWARFALVLGPVLVGVLVYVGACAALRVEELNAYVGKISRRLAR